MNKLAKVGLALSILSTLASSVAHELIRSKDGGVAVMVHIEPDDNPGVGVSTVWFELTQKGGMTLALSSCTCTLKVYQGAYKAGMKPLQVAKLYVGKEGEGKGNPNGAVNFPAVGAYTLRIEGKPRTGQNGAGSSFAPFVIEVATRADKK